MAGAQVRPVQSGAPPAGAEGSSAEGSSGIEVEDDTKFSSLGEWDGDNDDDGHTDGRGTRISPRQRSKTLVSTASVHVDHAGDFDTPHVAIDWEVTQADLQVKGVTTAKLMRLMQQPLYATNMQWRNDVLDDLVSEDDLTVSMSDVQQTNDALGSVHGGWGAAYVNDVKQRKKCWRRLVCRCKSRFRCCRTEWEQLVMHETIRRAIDDKVDIGSLTPTQVFSIDTAKTSADHPWPVDDGRESSCSAAHPHPKSKFEGQKVQQYSIWDADGGEFGQIGGAGLRIYFNTRPGPPGAFKCPRRSL